jgi:ketopantoate reductase
VAAANEAVSAVLETELPEMVRDADIEAALQDIWAMRSAAFGATNMQVRKTRELVDMVTKSAEEAQAAVAQARSMMQVDGNTLGTKPKSKSGA